MELGDRMTKVTDEEVDIAVPAVDGEAQNGLNDIFPGDPYPVASIVQAIQSRSVQAIHAGISRRDWQATETAANELRDALGDLVRRLRGAKAAPPALFDAALRGQIEGALKAAFKLPRPWIDGKISEQEWSAAFDQIEAALASLNATAPNPADA